MDGRRVVVYEIIGASIPFRAVGSFETATSFVCMYEQNLYTLEPGKIQVRNFQVIHCASVPLYPLGHS